MTLLQGSDCGGKNSLERLRMSSVKSIAWRSGYCYLKKGKCNLNQSTDDSFAERVAKKNC